MSVKSSIVLCTYNSEKFLPPFLASIRAQEVLPDELIVSDDGSTDGTASLIETFRGVVSFPIKFIANKDRVGFAQNFSRAFSHATGEIIFPADHDDVWLPKKIKVFLKEFADRPNTELVFSNSFLSHDGRTSFSDYWSRVHLSSRDREDIRRNGGFEIFLKRGVVPGHAMAVRRDSLRRWTPIPGGWPHDHWLCMLASAGNSISVLEEPLVYYVIHASQELGMAASGLSERIRRATARSLALNRAEADKMAVLISKCRALGISEKITGEVEGRRQHFERRASLGSSLFLRASGVLAEYVRGGYSRYENGLSSAVKDLFSNG